MNYFDQISHNNFDNLRLLLTKDGDSTEDLNKKIVFKKHVEIVNMDLEGWETKALAGCIDHIKNDRPKLAIAAYHKASDFRDILKQVRSYRSDYQIYLRHYTQGWSETVMFFI